jgi:hypothetical protein
MLMQDLAGRLANHVQPTTDEHCGYLEAARIRRWALPSQCKLAFPITSGAIDEIVGLLA